MDEFTFRFNRRTSRSRGLLFYRLLQQAVATAPVPRKAMLGGLLVQQTTGKSVVEQSTHAEPQHIEVRGVKYLAQLWKTTGGGRFRRRAAVQKWRKRVIGWLTLWVALGPSRARYRGFAGRIAFNAGHGGYFASWSAALWALFTVRRKNVLDLPNRAGSRSRGWLRLARIRLQCLDRMIQRLLQVFRKPWSTGNHTFPQ